MAPRLLLTGGRGFIGSRTSEALAETEWQVILAEDICPDADLHIPAVISELLEVSKPDRVLHLAWAASGTAGYRDHPDNPQWVETTVRLAEECGNASIGFIGTGSVVEIGESGSDLYTRAKSELWEALSPKIFNSEIAWLRPHYVFDPKARRPDLMNEIARALDNGERPILKSPSELHDFVHVTDVARAIALVVDLNLSGLIQIGSGTLHSVAEFASAAGVRITEFAEAKRLAKRFEQQEPGRLADISKLQEVGWRPSFTEQFFG